MSHHFYDTIFHMRQHEEVMLYERMIQYSPEDEDLVKEFLQIEYDTEKSGYPFVPPAFDGAAALWAAKITYTSCQLLLFRENKENELPFLLPAFDKVVDPSSILSADLCLRFLPQVLLQTRRIDPDDRLISEIEKHLIAWHYSSIGYTDGVAIESDDPIYTNDCLQQLYADRVVEKKDISRARQSPLSNKINADLGLYASVFWRTLNTSDQ